MQQRDNLDLARVLLARAIDDEGLVRKVSTDTDIADAIVGFHCQQAVEKLVKAVLTAHGMAFPKSHDMEYLIDLVAQGGINTPEGIRDAEALSPWAVEFRYEGEESPVLDRAGSLTLVEQLRSWAESEIETAGQQMEPEALDDEPRQSERG